MQIGGLSGSLLYSILIRFMSIPVIWMIAAFIVLFSIALTARKLINAEKITSENTFHA